jgi:crotonobetainyl-CoA:carnitine CoA-transferase CaiB-like acyl-CoA transferase
MAPRQFDSTQQGPLAGIRVLDLSRLVAGNMATLLLGDYGADVIKIEHPDKGDDLRRWRAGGVETFWKIYGRNKRSLALDIRRGDGRENFLRLLPTAHVLVENFVPGTLEKWGLGEPELLAINSRLVILRISGWGQTGPYRERPGFGTLVEAMSGFAHLNGFPDRPPALPPLAMADMVAGLYGAFAVLAAVRVAEKEGRGQSIDLSLFEPMLSLVSSEAVKFRVTGEVTERTGNQAPHTAPRNVYSCSDGGFVAVSGSMQSMAELIMDTVGRPELKSDPRFVTNDARVANRDELDAIIGGFVAARGVRENLALFEAAGVPCAPVYSMREVVDDPYVTGRGALTEVADRDLGSVPMHEITPRLTGTPGAFRYPAPRLGEHTDEILAELEYAATEVERSA